MYMHLSNLCISSRSLDGAFEHKNNFVDDLPYCQESGERKTHKPMKTLLSFFAFLIVLSNAFDIDPCKFEVMRRRFGKKEGLKVLAHSSLKLTKDLSLISVSN